MVRTWVVNKIEILNPDETKLSRITATMTENGEEKQFVVKGRMGTPEEQSETLDRLYAMSLEEPLEISPLQSAAQDYLNGKEV